MLLTDRNKASKQRAVATLEFLNQLHREAQSCSLGFVLPTPIKICLQLQPNAVVEQHGKSMTHHHPDPQGPVHSNMYWSRPAHSRIFTCSYMQMAIQTIA